MKRFVIILSLMFAACGDSRSPDRRGGGTSPDNLTGDRTGEPKNRQTPDPGNGTAGAGYPLDTSLRLNELQWKGSHNSYHLTPPGASADQQYDMPPLREQLALHGVRSLELDLHYYEGEFYVYHLPVDDDRSTCPRFLDCLAEIRAWSEANPGHQPLTVFLDFRDEWDAEKLIDHLDDSDAAITSNWPREKLLVPDDIIGSSPDLRSAVQTRGWPTLGQTRGKTLFIMWSFGDAPWLYAHEGTSLQGRPMFVAATYEGWPHAMILGMDTAHEQENQIKGSVARGYLVRTRSDDLPGRGGDFPARRDAAFRSGAQAVMTDYPANGSLPGYSMNVPGGSPSRCNPITAPGTCTAWDVENPALLAGSD